MTKSNTAELQQLFAISKAQRRSCKSQWMERYEAKGMSGHDMRIGLKNSMYLCIPAYDLQQITLFGSSALSEEGLLNSSLKDCQQLTIL